MEEKQVMTERDLGHSGAEKRQGIRIAEEQRQGISHPIQPTAEQKRRVAANKVAAEKILAAKKAQLPSSQPPTPRVTRSQVANKSSTQPNPVWKL